MAHAIHHGNCLDILPTLPAQSVDAVITDPPYPEISRDYGRMTEAEWWDMMMGVCVEVRRVLKPTGSAVFILQPNSRKVGSMRGWLWRFMWWVTEEWNMVQDAYWWNIAALPLAGAPTAGLMRPSLKACVWAGPNNCYRNQDAVLQPETAANQRMRNSDVEWAHQERTSPSGRSVRNNHMGNVAQRRGGVTPFNVLAMGNQMAQQSSGSYGHGAGTPLKLADWWTRYIVPAGGTALDPFNGAGTMGVAALQNGCNYIGIERMAKYVDVTHERLAKVQPMLAEAAD